MEAMRVFTKIESDTIRIPELTGFVGREVEVIVIDNNKLTPAKQHDSFFALAGKIDIEQELIFSGREQSIV